MISKQTCVAILILMSAVGFGTGCNQQKQSADQAGTTTAQTEPGGTPSETGSAKPDKRHHLTATHYAVTIQEDQGTCYADQPWLSADPSSNDTVQWSSGTGSAYLVEFHATPLTDGTTAQYVVTVPSSGPSTSYSVVDNGNACQNKPGLASCYFQYSIIKVSNSPTRPSDFCGPSPLTVGIHIKP